MKSELITVGITSLLFSGFSTSAAELPKDPEAKKPNIVILFADDLGYGDLGIYGHPTIKTPNLDQMAMQGMKFTQFYAAAPVSTPSRGALLTGRLPVRNGVHSGVFFPDSKLGIPAEEITLAEALTEEGYATACFGKWHLGHHQQYLPTNNGFDEYFGLPYSNDMEGDPASEWKRKRKFPPIPLIEGTKVIKNNPDQSLLTGQYTKHALDFIKRNKKNPFFLYVPYTFPHVPLFASDDFLGTSSRGLYGDVVQEIDWSVGQILTELKKQGLDENTFVFFTSDNGPWLSEKQEGGSAGLFREGKNTCWEGGMREPAIAWWPGTIQAGQVTEALASTMDLFVTSLALAGVELPNDRTYDGMDISAVLKGEKENIRDILFYYHGTGLFAIRKGPWKLHFQSISKPYQGKNKVYKNYEDAPLLFNIEIDPSEKYNVADKHPEIIKEILKIRNEHKANLKIKPSVINPPKK